MLTNSPIERAVNLKKTEPSSPSKALASSLHPLTQLMQSEEIQELMARLSARASLLVTFLLWIGSIGAGLFFFWQNEADWYAPLILGCGLWLLWRIGLGGWIRFFFFFFYLLGDLFFIADRVFPHPVWRNGKWTETPFSLGLLVCSFTLILALLISIWDTYKRLRFSQKYKPWLDHTLQALKEGTPIPSLPASSQREEGKGEWKSQPEREVRGEGKEEGH